MHSQPALEALQSLSSAWMDWDLTAGLGLSVFMSLSRGCLSPYGMVAVVLEQAVQGA